MYAEVSFSKENSKYESNLSSAFLFLSCTQQLKEFFKSPALDFIMCSMTRDDDEGLSISLQRRIEEHWGVWCLITTHCIRGIGHRIHPDIRLPIVRWGPGLPLEVARQVWRRPRCALRWNVPANFPSLIQSHRRSWKWPGVGEWHKLCRVGWTRWNYGRAAADPGGKIKHPVSPLLEVEHLRVDVLQLL